LLEKGEEVMTIAHTRLSNACRIFLITVGVLCASSIRLYAKDMPNVSSKRDDPTREAKEKIRADQKKAFDGLPMPRHSDPPAVQYKLLTAYKNYLSIWTNTPVVRYADDDLNSKAALALREAEIVYKEARDAGEYKDEVDRLIRDIRDVADLVRRAEMLKNFLDKQPASDLPEQARAHRDSVETKRKDTVKRLEEQQWMIVMDRIKDRSMSFDDNIKAIKDFRSKNMDTPYRAQADNEIKRLETDKDRKGYERIRAVLTQYQESSSNSVPTPGEVAALADRMRKYREGQSPDPKMKADVAEWLQWYDRISKAKTVSVDVASAGIDRNSYLNHRWDSWIMLHVRHKSLDRGLADEKEHKKTEDGVQTIKLDTKFENIPHDPECNLQMEIVSRWSWTRGPIDRAVPLEFSIVSRQVPIMYEKARIGTLYINVDQQPGLRAYSDAD
jgi:hypothetical protein